MHEARHHRPEKDSSFLSERGLNNQADGLGAVQ